MSRLLLTLSLAVLPLFNAGAQVTSCTRQAPGSAVFSPEQLQSQNGALTVDFSIINSLPGTGFVYFCYIYADGTQSPTLAVNPGDTLTLNLADQMTILIPPPSVAPAMARMHMTPSATPAAPVNPCGDTNMMFSSTNLHFHGLNIPPVCHADDTINTLLQVGEPPFQYQIRIPRNDPPGMFWYHPHPHGFSELQVLGGASGVIIINGMEQVKPQTAGLPQQVMVIRDEALPGTELVAAKSVSNATPRVATKQLTVNYIPIVAPYTVLPVLTIKPSEKQFWRVANASADTFLDLQVQIAGKAENVEVIALDGVPTSTVAQVPDILVPPGGRAEFIMQGPAAGVAAEFVSLPVFTGYGGDVDPLRPIARIVASANAAEPAIRIPAAPANAGPKRFDSLISQTPVTTRKLYFSEKDPQTSALTQFYITVDGQTPVVYSSANPPAIVTTIGAVEDWTIENRALEDHAFHIHQLHYLLLETNGVAETTPMMLDTVRVQHWDGKSSTYPSVKIRMDFRDPDIAGTFVYHCHILEHEDAGMMAKIQVNPAAVQPSVKPSAKP